MNSNERLPFWSDPEVTTGFIRRDTDGSFLKKSDRTQTLWELASLVRDKHRNNNKTSEPVLGDFSLVSEKKKMLEPNIEWLKTQSLIPLTSTIQIGEVNYHLAGFEDKRKKGQPFSINTDTVWQLMSTLAPVPSFLNSKAGAFADIANPEFMKDHERLDPVGWAAIMREKEELTLLLSEPNFISFENGRRKGEYNQKQHDRAARIYIANMFIEATRYLPEKLARSLPNISAVMTAAILQDENKLYQIPTYDHTLRVAALDFIHFFALSENPQVRKRVDAGELPELYSNNPSDRASMRSLERPEALRIIGNKLKDLSDKEKERTEVQLRLITAGSVSDDQLSLANAYLESKGTTPFEKIMAVASLGREFVPFDNPLIDFGYLYGNFKFDTLSEDEQDRQFLNFRKRRSSTINPYRYTELSKTGNSCDLSEYVQIFSQTPTTSNLAGGTAITGLKYQDETMIISTGSEKTNANEPNHKATSTVKFSEKQTDRKRITMDSVTHLIADPKQPDYIEEKDYSNRRTFPVILYGLQEGNPFISYDPDILKEVMTNVPPNIFQLNDHESGSPSLILGTMALIYRNPDIYQKWPKESGFKPTPGNPNNARRQTMAEAQTLLLSTMSVKRLEFTPPNQEI